MELDMLKVKALKLMSLDGEIRLQQCPPEFRKVAEKIVIMLDAEPFRDTYVTMTELDKKLTLRYWLKYDGLEDAIAIIGEEERYEMVERFADWFLSQATMPDIISRARRYLVSDAKILIIPKRIAKHAKEAESKWGRSIYAHGGG